MYEIKDLLFKLVSIPSINGTEGEVKIAHFIYEYLLECKKSYNLYDQDLSVFFQPIKQDTLGRKNVIAVIKGRKSESNKCIVFLGHFDTVDIEDYGNIKQFAFDPIKLKSKLKEILQEKGLEFEGFEFGRGIFDMKGGIAVNIQVLNYLAQNIENFSGYVIFLFVCDEEGDSKGMINALEFLRNFQKDRGLEFIFCINTDYSVGKKVYLGSIGKVLVGILVRGIETHVGQSLEGINPNYILSCILSNVENNTDLIEFFENEFTSPPVVMKVRDMRESYNVKTNLYAFAYVNHLFFQRDFSYILGLYKSIAKQTVENIIETRMKLIEKLGLEYHISTIPVYTLQEFCRIYGKKFKVEESFVIDGKYQDYREGLIYLLKDWIDNLGVNYPLVLLFYLPPFYPSVRTDLALRKLIQSYFQNLNDEIEIRYYFPYISDLSFLGQIGDYDYLEDNMVGNCIDLKDKISMPCINWGVTGFDAHKFTERIEIEYSLYKLPRYLYEFVLQFLC
ncbi:MAG: M20/M25/M40 family metallo-hydrolase [bacterium]